MNGWRSPTSLNLAPLDEGEDIVVARDRLGRQQPPPHRRVGDDREIRRRRDERPLRASTTLPSTIRSRYSLSPATSRHDVSRNRPRRNRAASPFTRSGSAAMPAADIAHHPAPSDCAPSAWQGTAALTRKRRDISTSRIDQLKAFAVINRTGTRGFREDSAAFQPKPAGANPRPREVQSSEAKTHLPQLLDAVEAARRSSLPVRGRPLPAWCPIPSARRARVSRRRLRA